MYILYVHIYVYTYICVYIYMCIHIYHLTREHDRLVECMYVCTSTDARTHTCIHVYTHVQAGRNSVRKADIRINARTRTRIHACTHTRIHAYTHTRIHVYTHTRLHAYTHTRVHARAGGGRNSVRKVPQVQGPDALVSQDPPWSPYGGKKSSKHSSKDSSKDRMLSCLKTLLGRRTGVI